MQEFDLIKEKKIQAREYQINLANSALEKGNTLIVLPTALGKTIIAALVTEKKLKKGKTMILAPTRPLVMQHKKSFTELFPWNVVESLTAQTTQKKRIKIINDASILISTPQIISNLIIQKKINLTEYNLLIVDEMHHSIGKYDYVFVSEKYNQENPSGLILGLTASPGHAKEKIKEICRNLFIKNVELRSREDKDVKKYVKEIKIEWKKVSLPQEFIELKEMLWKMNIHYANKLKSFPGIRARVQTINRKYLIELQNKISIRIRNKKENYLFEAMKLIAILMKLNHAITLLETQGILSLKKFLMRLKEKNKKAKADKILLESNAIQFIDRKCDELIEKKLLHPKLIKLKEIMEKELIEKPELKTIIFNHYRDNVRQIKNYLKESKLIKPEIFIGQANKEKDKGMSQKKQLEKIEEFKDGQFNTLIATMVAEEGLDLPEVDLVILFEPVPSEIRTIQRIGRTARKRAGKAIILITTGTRDEAHYFAALRKEKNMKNTLKKITKEDLIREKNLFDYEIKEPKEKIEKEMITITNSKQNHDEIILSKKIEKKKNNDEIKEQTIMKEFFERKKIKNESDIKILIDYRESKSLVVKELSKKCNIELINLEFGDFVLSKDVVVERKTTQDFLNSLIDGRLFQQINHLTAYNTPLILLEGNYEDLFNRNIHKNAIIGALTSIALTYKIPILFSAGQEETVDYLINIAKKEQLEGNKELRLRIGRKGLNKREQQQFIIESLPLVGPVLAKNLLEKFESIEKIINASEKELQEVPLVGKKIAKEIKKIIQEKYSKEEY